jgi:hypothetical protein
MCVCGACRTLDRGTGFYQQERLNKRKASLLGSGK